MENPSEIGAEVAFMRKVWRRHLKRPVRRVLDVGPAVIHRMGWPLARTGMEVRWHRPLAPR